MRFSAKVVNFEKKSIFNFLKRKYKSLVIKLHDKDSSYSCTIDLNDFKKNPDQWLTILLNELIEDYKRFNPTKEL